jgi:hypothetical protein
MGDIYGPIAAQEERRLGYMDNESSMSHVYYVKPVVGAGNDQSYARLSGMQ